ncbi:MAG: hypothetical protein HYY61_04850, partial [Deltaproteobacteria bacterium]|nr:hypothetical protein [Deltaproteobacteria bacterium]
MERQGVLFIGLQKDWFSSAQCPYFHVYHVPSLKEASSLLKTKPIKVILSPEVQDFEYLKKVFPETVRILLIDKLDAKVTKEAINGGEVFRFILKSSSSKEIREALIQGTHHFDLVSKHEHLTANLKIQNKKLEKFIQKLESQVARRTQRLQSVEGELHKTKRYLEQLNHLIAWINASSTQEELATRVEKALKGILSIEKVILSETIAEDTVKKIKELGLPSIVIPLIYQKKCLGHLYFLCENEEKIIELYEKIDLIKQVSDAVALTLEKIHIFTVSIARKEEWQKTFDAIIDPVSLVDKDYTIVRANVAYSQISGMKIQELVGQKCYKVFQKRESPCEGCLLKESLSRKKPQTFDLKSMAQNTFYATSSFPTKPLEEKLVVQYYRDQGEEKRLRDQLIQAEKMAEIGILAGSVAHEINNPLGGILAFAQILLSEIPSQNPMHEDVKAIEAAALRSKQIVENLLYFSRASKEEDWEFLDVQKGIEKALSLIELNIRHRNLTLGKHFEPVPKIYGDFNQLVQVFLNLFQNSLQAIFDRGQKGGNLEISIGFLKEGKQVCVTVHGSGVGIAG